MIDYRENLTMALDTILSHKFRSFLTVLGIIVGILTVIVIASILSGMTDTLVSRVSDLGTNNIIAFHLDSINIGSHTIRRSSREMRRKPLTIEDAEAVREFCPSVRDVTWRVLNFGGQSQIQYRGSALRGGQLIGSPSNYVNVASLNMALGRFFTEAEDSHRMKVCVLGPDASKVMFRGEDPLGKQIQVQGHPFTVLGVAEQSKMGSMIGQADNFVIIPYGTYHKMMPKQDILIILIQAHPGALSTALDETESLLRRRRGVKPNEANTFDLTTSDRLIQQLNTVLGTVGLIAIAISSVGLLVGGIGVMNIMLVSVNERTHEIGIRMAVGARQDDILQQFLIEAVLVCLLGGTIGILLSFGVALVFPFFVKAIVMTFSILSIVAAVACSSVIGVLFGFLPARNAARLDPIEALARE